MFKIAIIEDNINDYSLLKSYLNKFVTVLPNELSAFNLVEI